MVTKKVIRKITCTASFEEKAAQIQGLIHSPNSRDKWSNLMIHKTASIPEPSGVKVRCFCTFAATILTQISCPFRPQVNIEVNCMHFTVVDESAHLSVRRLFWWSDAFLHAKQMSHMVYMQIRQTPLKRVDRDSSERLRALAEASNLASST